jgi:hypothetical protein
MGDEDIDWGDDDWEIDGWRPVPDDFDWSRYRNGRILGEDELSDKPRASPVGRQTRSQTKQFKIWSDSDEYRLFEE